MFAVIVACAASSGKLSVRNFKNILRRDLELRRMLDESDALGRLPDEERARKILRRQGAMVTDFGRFCLALLQRFGLNRVFVFLERDAVPVKVFMDVIGFTLGIPVETRLFALNRKMLPQSIQ